MTVAAVPRPDSKYAPGACRPQGVVVRPHGVTEDADEAGLPRRCNDMPYAPSEDGITVIGRAAVQRDGETHAGRL